jgi:hypothetical protein
LGATFARDSRNYPDRSNQRRWQTLGDHILVDFLGLFVGREGGLAGLRPHVIHKKVTLFGAVLAKTLTDGEGRRVPLANR